jgi:hypothetical protein
VPTYGQGFFDREGSGADRWRWTERHAELSLENPADEARTVRLSTVLRTDAEQPGTATIRLPDGRTLREPFDKEGKRLHLTFEVEPGRSVVSFDSEATPVKTADGRGLWLQLRNPVVVGDELCPAAGWSCTDGPRPQLP